MQVNASLGVLRIPLCDRHGEVVAVALLDGNDHALAQYSWCLSGTNGYAIRRRRYGGGRREAIYLHRAVLGLQAGDPRQGDHINRDRLDCRRENLRIVTRAQNAQNVSADRGSASPYRGVHWNPTAQKWRAVAVLAGRRHSLGYFAREEDAAAAASAFRRENMPFAVEAS